MSLLRRITDLVDKDVAANSRPVSMIAAAIPFLPFMIFVDGAPVDHYPLLSLLALAVSFCWVAFVIWRALRHARRELEGFGYLAGSARFWRLVIGTISLVAGVIAAVMWVQNKSI